LISEHDAILAAFTRLAFAETMASYRETIPPMSSMNHPFRDRLAAADAELAARADYHWPERWGRPKAAKAAGGHL
jgi:hypothetical protein